MHRRYSSHAGLTSARSRASPLARRGSPAVPRGRVAPTRGVSTLAAMAGASAAGSVDVVLRSASQPIIEHMLDADERRRASNTRLLHANESDLKAAIYGAVTRLGPGTGLAVRPTEMPIHPREWARVGNVDIVFERRRGSVPAAFIQLKWARKDKLVALRVGPRKDGAYEPASARRAQPDLRRCVGRGTAHPLRPLLQDTDTSTEEFLRSHTDAMRLFCFREDGRAHPTGPYWLPPRFTTHVVAEYPFALRDRPWTLTLVGVVAAPEGDLIAIDDRGLPAAKPPRNDPSL